MSKTCTLTRKDGHQIYYTKEARLLHDQQGEVIGAVETFVDIGPHLRQQQEIESLRQQIQLDSHFHGLIGESCSMQNLYSTIRNVGLSEAPVLISGESGTGKEMVAKAIHECSPRAHQPFVKVNCSALNENLLESELFGHVKGAYTGAHQTRRGRFEMAHGGTIFLDEIGDISLNIQLKLLQVMEDKVIERVGDNRRIPIDVRIVSASHKSLDELMELGQFREDLYYRLCVFPLHLPSLKDRSQDIVLIARSFMQKCNALYGKNIKGFSAGALDLLMSYDWPGNVRELRNTIEYAFVVCNGNLIQNIHLPKKVTQIMDSVSESCELSKRERLVKALHEAKGNQSIAAEKLGVSRVTVWKNIKKYSLNLA
jgi:two-component system, NtrC family, response regulator HydG